MKLLRILFGCFCLLIAAVALFNFIATPNDQPLKDITTFIVLPITAYGVFAKRTGAMLAFPMLFLITTGISLGGAKNMSYVLGGMIGGLIPLGIWYLIFRDIKKTNESASPKSA